jgi:hypothetical protein
MREYTLRFRAGLVSVAEGLGLLKQTILKRLASAKRRLPKRTGASEGARKD